MKHEDVFCKTEVNGKVVVVVDQGYAQSVVRSEGPNRSAAARMTGREQRRYAERQMCKQAKKERRA